MNKRVTELVGRTAGPYTVWYLRVQEFKLEFGYAVSAEFNSPWFCVFFFSLFHRANIKPSIDR